MEEKHKCKLCLRNFANGKALGGHMRSHMMNLPVPPKPNESPPMIQLSFEADSASSPSSSSKSLSYGLRENPKRSFRFADPEFFDEELGNGILQDRESETESGSKNLTRRRSKRVRRQPNDSSSTASDITTEEDIAFCLIMMSRDSNNWKRKDQQEEELEEEDGYEDEDEDEDEEESDDEFEEVKLKSLKTSSKVRGRYKCETCNKVFRSYQALGGHRASHKKIKMVNHEELVGELENNNVNNNGQGYSVVVLPLEKKIHECPVCFRVFASGQALGGHKRTHVIGSATVTVTAATTATVGSSIKFGDSLIDLNLPAPMDDDDASLIEESAVSDAEFIKHS